MDPNSLYSLVFDAIRDPLVVVDKSGAVLLANASAQAYFEFDDSRSLNRMRPANANVVVDASAIADLAGRYNSIRDYRLPDRNGKDSGVTLSIDAFTGPDGTSCQVIQFRDESPAVHREFWKDEMIALVSHEIKNPLSAMKNSVDILLSQAPGQLTEGQRQFLSTSGRNIDRLTHMVDGFLDVSRIRAGAFSLHRVDIDLRDFIGRVVDSFATMFNTKRVRIDWDVDRSITRAWIDPAKVEQVLINLLSNALKFTAVDGEVSVKVSPAGLESLGDDVRLLPWDELGRPQLVSITVRDTGLGMSTETLDHLFERHYSADDEEKPDGAHLGLNISRTLVEAQHGWVDVDSQLGIGTAVTVCLPANRTTSAIMSRAKRAEAHLNRLLDVHRPAKFYMLGKFNDENWVDIAREWEESPVVNPDSGDISATFGLWTLSSELAVAIRDDSDGKVPEELFGHRFVLYADDTYILAGYALGCADAPEEATTFAQVFNIAAGRMRRAREVMAKADMEALDDSLECVEVVQREVET